RRSSATHLANQGASMTRLMQHGRWNSSEVAMGYVASSEYEKLEVADLMAKRPPRSIPLETPDPKRKTECEEPAAETKEREISVSVPNEALVSLGCIFGGNAVVNGNVTINMK